jgi:hypothetical protein
MSFFYLHWRHILLSIAKDRYRFLCSLTPAKRIYHGLTRQKQIVNNFFTYWQNLFAAAIGGNIHKAKNEDWAKSRINRISE